MRYYSKKICIQCERRRVVLLTGHKCPQCLSANNDRYRASRRSAAIRPLVMRAVWSEASSRCEYCGLAVHRKRDRYDRRKNVGEVDHVWPAFLGGKGDRRNLKLACRSCNRAREVLFVESSRALRAVVRAFTASEADDTVRAIHQVRCVA